MQDPQPADVDAMCSLRAGNIPASGRDRRHPPVPKHCARRLTRACWLIDTPRDGIGHLEFFVNCQHKRTYARIRTG